MQIFWKGIFVNMQAKRRALGPKNSKKTSLKYQDGILIKIFNEKSWPRQEEVISNLRNLENVKSKLEKLDFHYVVSYF